MVTSEKKDEMRLGFTRKRAKAQICRNLICAGVLLLSEVGRYKTVVLDSYDNLTLAAVLVVSHQLREEGGEFLRD